ncbi:HypC/HybG/HupF family hydrogenase formation chaperone [Pandoraea sputorum]|uniref:HypC/HybG/HupF family hydrogenase formation chaperone n=1 Tax=Pandoraea sputorum TaxID=93222 RepID=UPI001241BDE4|nr:HypC/HybG/HupF family hydrogenase formation chaperone [Pandoraea sputorum]VVE58879.1 hydrogenase assembly protein HupF [Pandoraea sputorum]
MCLAIPGELLSVDDDDPLTRQGRVAFGGVVMPVNLAYVPKARPGDYVLVHAGFAIAVIDERQAEQTLAYLTDQELPGGAL